jgi:hypothetical protein
MSPEPGYRERRVRSALRLNAAVFRVREEHAAIEGETFDFYQTNSFLRTETGVLAAPESTLAYVCLLVC